MVPANFPSQLCPDLLSKHYAFMLELVAGRRIRYDTDSDAGQPTLFSSQLSSRIKLAIAMHPTAFDPGIFPGLALIQFEKTLLFLYACSITMECKGLYMHKYIDAG